MSEIRTMKALYIGYPILTDWLTLTLGLGSHLTLSSDLTFFFCFVVAIDHVYVVGPVFEV